NSSARQDPLEILEKEIPVLKEPEHAQVDGHADDQPEPALVWAVHFPHFSPEIKIERSRGEEQGGERRIPGAVKNVARDQKKVLARLPRTHRPVGREHQKEENDESERVEKHRGAVFLIEFRLRRQAIYAAFRPEAPAASGLPPRNGGCPAIAARLVGRTDQREG